MCKTILRFNSNWIWLKASINIHQSNPSPKMSIKRKSLRPRSKRLLRRNLIYKTASQRTSLKLRSKTKSQWSRSSTHQRMIKRRTRSLLVGNLISKIARQKRSKRKLRRNLIEGLTSPRIVRQRISRKLKRISQLGSQISPRATRTTIMITIRREDSSKTDLIS